VNAVFRIKKNHGESMRWAKYFDFTRATVFCLWHRFTKHKTTRYARNLWGMAPLTPSRLRLYFLWLRMLSVSLKGYFYKTHIAYRLALIQSTCSLSLKSEVWIIHANTPTALSRFRNFIFRHRDVMQKNISSVKKNVIFAEFFTPPRFNVDKPT